MEVCRVLLEHNKNVKLKDIFGRTPLHYADGEEVARLLLKHGADANALDFRGQTPLHHLSFVKRLGAVRVLLEHGVDANTRDADNATPLHLACNYPYPEHEGSRSDVVRLLLQYGCDIDARDNEGCSPFMRATARGMDGIMRLLLEYGAEGPTPQASRSSAHMPMPTPMPVPMSPLGGGGSPVTKLKFNAYGKYTSLVYHSPHSVLFEEELYPTALHLFEAHKFLDHRPDFADRIRQCERVEDVTAVSAELAEFTRRDWGNVALSTVSE